MTPEYKYLWENSEHVAIQTALVCRRSVRAVARAADACAQPDAQPVIRFTLPPVTVTAQKEPADPQTLPVSVTAVTAGARSRTPRVRSVSDAAGYAPNTYFNEFTVRKLSNARFRGVGASPANPGVASYIDGVPQLNANSSSVELIDVDQIEFVRGPQSALFGRNALGGVINITSGRPSLTKWSGGLSGPYGNFNGGDLRGAASGPIVANKVAVECRVRVLDAGRLYEERPDRTRPRLAVRRLRQGTACCGSRTPAGSARAMFNGERARDGDYALNDLAAVRANPFHVSRDFEGFAHRDILAQTVQVTYLGPRVDFSTTTGFLKWKTEDLDGSRLHRRCRSLHATTPKRTFQFTEEARFSSSKAAPVVHPDRVTMKWQAGLFAFTQNYAAGRRQQLLAVRAVAIHQLSHQSAFTAVDARRSRPRHLWAGHLDRSRRAWTSSSACAPTASTRQRR